MPFENLSSSAESKGKDLPPGASTFGRAKFPGAVKGYASFNTDIPLHGLPQEYWMNLEPDVIRRPMWGTKTGTPQILMNYARIGRGPWRMKALVDEEGHPVTSSFLVFRILSHEWSLHALWAVLNSPLANAYMFCNTMERANPSGVFRNIPIPLSTRISLDTVDAMAHEYFALMNELETGFQLDSRYTEAAHLLTAIDAEVMRLYGLPPAMEKRVLDLFQGIQRKGVDFPFKGYYPKDFNLPIPLYKYLSGRYSGSLAALPDKGVTRKKTSVRGTVLGADQDDMTIEVQLIDARKVKAPIAAQHLDRILDAFNKYKAGTRVLLQGIGRFNRSERLLGFDSIEHVSILDALDPIQA